eukprot:m.148051 g.148051  ORF g.148051 m.148051 type:complete len:92 (+) comp38489_c1_seq1:1055-1330(+)
MNSAFFRELDLADDGSASIKTCTLAEQTHDSFGLLKVLGPHQQTVEKAWIQTISFLALHISLHRAKRRSQAIQGICQRSPLFRCLLEHLFV